MENIVKLPTLSFGEAIKSALNKLTDFNGRARRSELWWFFLLYAIASIIASALVSNEIAGIIVNTILLLLVAAVTIRRLHDRGQGGWWVTASILLSVFSSCYMFAKGYTEMGNTVNFDPEEAMTILKDPVTIIIGIASFVINIAILIFCLLDSKPESNKYGDSPKYINEGVSKDRS